MIEATVPLPPELWATVPAGDQAALREQLATLRLANRRGAVLVTDERVAERFGAFGDDAERLMYAWSVLFCLPTGLADAPSVGTGTIMQPATLRAYAAEAGFRGVEILPIENDF
jgi:hypothetical protein